jgi:outer membrane protein OmpA-like peptidoglycan-associated protein
MKLLRRRVVLLVFCSFSCFGAVAADVEGSSDYPEIGRYEGSEIILYRAESYGSTTIATGPVQKKSDAESTSLTLEGDITRIVYHVPEGFSALEVFRNLEARVQEADYELIVSGGPDVFKNYTFLYEHPAEKLQAISISGTLWYLSAKKQVGEATTYLSVLVSPYSGGGGQRARLIAVTTKAMENRMVDAEKMRTSLAESGKVALYGIYFATDSAEIQAESSETLGEIARLLEENPELSIIVVGHTDNQGSWDYNMDLSERRAASVAESLIDDYGINSQRLRSAGVGYLAPAATNNTAEGRQLNRRVELVSGN